MSATLNRENRAKGSEVPERAKETAPPLAGSSRPTSPGPTLTRAGAGRVSGHAPRSLSGEVFSINFIRHETLPVHIRRAGIYAALGYVAVNLLIALGLLGMVAHFRGEARRLQVAIQGPRPSAEAVKARQQAMQTLSGRASDQLAKLQKVIAIQEQRFPVAGKLASLTKTLPPRAWITGITGSRDERTLRVQAAYLIDPEQPSTLPAKAWIDALKADEQFRQGLKRLELGSSSRKTQGNAKLFEFELIAEW